MSLFSELKRRNVFRAGIACVLDVDLATMDLLDGGIEEWGRTPVSQGMRQNPRFETYLKKAGLIDYWDATAWPDWCQRKNDGKVVCK